MNNLNFIFNILECRQLELCGEGNEWGGGRGVGVTSHLGGNGSGCGYLCGGGRGGGISPVLRLDVSVREYPNGGGQGAPSGWENIPGKGWVQLDEFWIDS